MSAKLQNARKPYARSYMGWLRMDIVNLEAALKIDGKEAAEQMGDLKLWHERLGWLVKKVKET